MQMERAGDHPNILRYICTETNDDFLYEIFETFIYII